VSRDLQHPGLWHFDYFARIVQQAISSTKKVPRRPISVWCKHGHFCHLIRKKNITVDMDVEKNPGPAIALNSSLSSLVDSRMVNFNSRYESSPLSLSSHLQMRLNCYANPLVQKLLCKNAKTAMQIRNNVLFIPGMSYSLFVLNLPD